MSKNEHCYSFGSNIVGVIQILLILGKIMDVPYVTNLSWWQIFIPVYAYFVTIMFAVIVVGIIIAFMKNK